MRGKIKEQSSGKKLLNVTLLYTEGCPATPNTIERIRECVAELGVRVELRKVRIDSQEEADRSRFLGSPTVQINGIDIDPSVRDSKVFGLM
jgi:metal-sulfur cluster biosynthetic enzyme